MTGKNTMVSTKWNKIVCFSLAATCLLVNPVSAISEERQGSISQGCASIRQSLKALQKDDSRNRIYLGTVYSSILNKFIIPLNKRLIGNNKPNISLVEIQSEYETARINFIDDFIVYSQDLETLINTDCQNNPNEFYNQLIITREKRSEVRQDTYRLNYLIAKHETAVNDMMEEE